MQTLLATIFVLGILIFVHELGHFLAAKSMGVAVHRFSFGLGPKTPLAFRWGETEYCLSWIPLGGYVKMAGLEEEGHGIEGEAVDAPVAPERTFDSKSLPARVFIISAGVLMNMLFAVVTYAVLAGMYGVVRDPSTTVGQVRDSLLPSGAGHLATLRPGDRLLRINGDTVTGWGDVQEQLLTSSELPIRIEVANRADPVLVDVPLSRQEDRVAVVNALVPWHEPVIGAVTEGRPAAQAGLREGDRIIRARGDTIPAWEVLVRAIESSPGEAVPLTVQRGGDTLALTVTPVAEVVRTREGERRVGKIGIGPFFPHEKFGIGGSIVQGFKGAARAGGMVLFTLKGLITGQLSLRDLGGPILVGQLSGEAARAGLDVLFGFMALFSMNLAILNLLPIPVLDGGHLMFMAIEAVRRKPLSLQQRARFTQVGFFILLAIMILAISNDIMRVIRGLVS